MKTRNSRCPIVVKLGGSLLGMPDLILRLKVFIRELDHPAIALVVGGGAATDIIRDQSRHGLDEEAAHWLALRALTLNARHLAAQFDPPASVSGNVEEWLAHWKQRRVILVDAFEFATRDESQLGRLPHCWSVTSDSVAARVAHMIGADKLYLLKSVTIAPDVDWAEAGRRGYVDSTFATLVGDLNVVSINFRDWTRSAASSAHAPGRHQ